MRSAVRSRLSPPKQKSHSVRNGFCFAGNEWREKPAVRPQAFCHRKMAAAQSAAAFGCAKRKCAGARRWRSRRSTGRILRRENAAFLRGTRKNQKKIRPARSKRSLRSIPLIRPFPFPIITCIPARRMALSDGFNRRAGHAGIFLQAERVHCPQRGLGVGQTAHRQCGHLRHGLRAACAAGSGCPCRALAADASSAEKALTAFCRGARGQLSWDGNKRTGLMPANKILLYRLMVASPLH